MTIKYTKELLIEAVKASESYSGVLRYLGLRQAGGTQAHIIKKVEAFNINTDHFKGQAHGKGKLSGTRKTAIDILIILPSGSNRPKRDQLLRAMDEVGIKYKCADCGQGNNWFNKKLTLEIDHIDGNWLNNKKDNLRFLCPNCHSQQSTSNKPWKFTSKPV